MIVKRRGMAADSGQTEDPSQGGGADPPEATDQEQWLVLMDPSWRPSTQHESPPVEAMVGLWPVEDGGIGKFRPNPGYVPADDRSPSDPLDAVLRLVAEGRAESRHIQLMLRGTLMDVAFNGDGQPLIGRAPDGILCAVIATGEVHRARIASPDWRRVDLAELVGLLNDRYDALFNPGGATAVRLTGDFLRQTLALDGDELRDMYSEYQNLNDLQIVPWDVTGDRSGNEPDQDEPSGDPTTTAERPSTTATG